jgi:hypothetical protein
MYLRSKCLDPILSPSTAEITGSQYIGELVRSQDFFVLCGDLACTVGNVKVTQY